MTNSHPSPPSPYGIRSDGVRNPIGQRTEHDDFSCAFTERKRAGCRHLPYTYGTTHRHKTAESKEKMRILIDLCQQNIGI